MARTICFLLLLLPFQSRLFAQDSPGSVVQKRKTELGPGNGISIGIRPSDLLTKVATIHAEFTCLDGKLSVRDNFSIGLESFDQHYPRWEESRPVFYTPENQYCNSVDLLYFPFAQDRIASFYAGPSFMWGKFTSLYDPNTPNSVAGCNCYTPPAPHTENYAGGALKAGLLLRPAKRFRLSLDAYAGLRTINPELMAGAGFTIAYEVWTR